VRLVAVGCSLLAFGFGRTEDFGFWLTANRKSSKLIELTNHGNYTHFRVTICRYNLYMAVFNEKQEELEHFEMRMGVPRGRLAVTMDLVTDAMALVGQHGVYCQSQRWPGKPVMDIQLVMKNLTDAKELIQSVMEELRPKS
jgi:hypothetical protein